MPMGFSFQPGADQSMQATNGQTGRSVAPPSSSVKVLSFRMPKNDVRGALAPSALLNASGAGGAQTGGLSPQLLSLLLSAFSAGPQQGGGPFDGGSSDPTGVVGPGPMSVPSFGAPRFTPGDEGDRFKLGDNVPGDMGGADIFTRGGGDGPPRQPGNWFGGPLDRQRLDDSNFGQDMGHFFR